MCFMFLYQFNVNINTNINIVIALDGIHSSAVVSLCCLFFCEVAVGVGGSDILLVTIEP